MSRSSKITRLNGNVFAVREEADGSLSFYRRVVDDFGKAHYSPVDVNERASVTALAKLVAELALGDATVEPVD